MCAPCASALRLLCGCVRAVPLQRSRSAGLPSLLPPYPLYLHPSRTPQERFKWNDKDTPHAPAAPAAVPRQGPAAAQQAGAKRQRQEGGARAAAAAAADEEEEGGKGAADPARKGLGPALVVSPLGEPSGWGRWRWWRWA